MTPDDYPGCEVPIGYCLLQKDEPMLAHYLIWHHPGQWEPFGQSQDTNYGWNESYRPVVKQCTKDDEMVKTRKSLEGDKGIRHQAWVDLGTVIEKLKTGDTKAIEKAIDSIRADLFVPGKHHSFTFKNDEPMENIINTICSQFNESEKKLFPKNVPSE